MKPKKWTIEIRRGCLIILKTIKGPKYHITYSGWVVPLTPIAIYRFFTK